MKRKTMKIKTLFVVLAFTLLAAGCAEQAAGPAAQEPVPVPAAQEPAPSGHENVLLVVSFGTSYDNRELSIGKIEASLQSAYPDFEVRRAFTSQIIIDKLKERDKLEIDNVKEAMDRLAADGFKNVVIQPTHVMDGYEYNDIVAEVSTYKDRFESLKIGKNLLASDEDYRAVATVVAQETKAYDVDKTAIVLMGHGTEAASNITYARMQKAFFDAGFSRYFVGTVEAAPDLQDVMALVKASGAKRVVLAPLMIVAGDHAVNDMAGDEEGSWKRAFENDGYDVVCLLRGLGEMQGIQELIVSHAGEAIAPGGGEKATPAFVDKPVPAESAAQPLNMNEKSAPVYGKQIKDGTYPIEVSSSSSMFRIVDAQLTVASGEMTAVLTLSGDGYEKLYMGTGEKALADTDDHCIYFKEDALGRYAYEVPVDALNQETDCAAWSIKKKTWYDRVLVFQSSLIPADAMLPA